MGALLTRRRGVDESGPIMEIPSCRDFWASWTITYLRDAVCGASDRTWFGWKGRGPALRIKSGIPRSAEGVSIRSMTSSRPIVSGRTTRFWLRGPSSYAMAEGNCRSGCNPAWSSTSAFSQLRLHLIPYGNNIGLTAMPGMPPPKSAVATIIDTIYLSDIFAAKSAFAILPGNPARQGRKEGGSS